EAFVDFHVKQEEGSTCQLLMSELSSANVRYTMDLLGRGAKSEVDGLFLATGSDHCVVDLRVNHQAVGCQSRSLIKGIASGQAYGEFKGLVYVATGAQQTDARQTSRNIELSNQAHIVTKPQLEIYADDVKCSHGATVGQLDNEAIYYMRQRGLSELQAQRLQVEGFAADIILRCPIETFCKQLAADVHTKMETL
ncbi:MAG: SufD family Fe-S cluster assembly protein, partial [Mucinivorans sp.]